MNQKRMRGMKYREGSGDPFHLTTSQFRELSDMNERIAHKKTQIRLSKGHVLMQQFHNNDLVKLKEQRRKLIR